MIRRLAVLLIGVSLICCSTRTGHAAVEATATFVLHTPTVTASQATFEIGLLFAGGDPSLFNIQVIQLSVVGSSPELTANNTSWTRFSFTPDSVVLDNWLSAGTLQLTGVDLFAPIPPDDNTLWLIPSATEQRLGELTVDLTGIPGGTDLFVTLESGADPDDTDVIGNVNSTDAQNLISYRHPPADYVAQNLPYGEVNFEPQNTGFQTVPEPASLFAWFGLCLGGVWIARSRRRVAAA